MVWGTSEWEAAIPSRPDGPLLRVWEAVPAAARLERDGYALRRDRYGNALGGLRLPALRRAGGHLPG